MTYIFKILLLSTLLIAPLSLPLYAQDTHSDHDEDVHEEDEHQEDLHGDEGHEDEITLISVDAESSAIAGIRVETLYSQELNDFIVAPGEVQLDQYSSAEVSSLVDAIVVERHAQLGQEVEIGQPLVTLASVEVAAAKGELRITATEWRRVRSLGESAVGAQRYVQAEIAYQQARLRLRAYGLDEDQVESIANDASDLPLGNFNLVAPVYGTVLSDDFRAGQRISAGNSLFVIADESRVWIETHVSPRQANSLEIGMPAQVEINGHWHEGTLIQKHHMLDEQTRTVPVRIALSLMEEHHHAGEFVRVSLSVKSEEQSQAIVVPESALAIGGDGDWVVFVETESGVFSQLEVERGTPWGNNVPIFGVEEGTRVVTEGAFFLAAELAKSGFDIHNH